MFRNLAPRWTPALWQWAFDYVAAYLDFDVSLVHIRIEDRRNDFAFGIKMNKWHLWSEPASLDSLWAARRHFVMKDIVFYLDPHCRAREVSQASDGFLTAEKGELIIDFPHIMSVVINHLPAPYNCGKMFKVRGFFEGVSITLHEDQMQCLLWDIRADSPGAQSTGGILIESVGRGAYLRWKRETRALCHHLCKPLTAEQRKRYIELYGTRRQVSRMGYRALRRRARELAEMEQGMTFSEIMLRR